LLYRSLFTTLRELLGSGGLGGQVNISVEWWPRG
jgi:hypothetical protein